MTRSTGQWTGKHDDEAIPPRVRLRVFEKHDGICPKCNRKLQFGRWALDHIVALVNGGQHAENNLQPLSISPCHSDKTKLDVAEKSRSVRKRKGNLGIKKRRKTIPGRRFDGTPIPSRWVE